MADISLLGQYEGVNLPYSPEAEQSVLGAILLDSSGLDAVLPILPNPEFFHLVNHRAIYGAMLSLNLLGQRVDFITVLERLKAEPDFDEGNGKAYLIRLAELVPSISNVETYAQIVREKYDLRLLISTARQVLDEAVESGAESNELLALAEQRFNEIRTSKSSQGLQHIGEVMVRLLDRLDELNSPNRHLHEGLPTGIGQLDKIITGLNKSDLVLLAARPGMGKTSFALNISRHVAVAKQRKVAFFSLEMTREQLAARLLSSEAHIASTKLRTGELDLGDWERLGGACDILMNAPIYLDDAASITTSKIKAQVHREKQVDLVVIDYLQLMRGDRRIDNRVQEISEITRNLKNMAKELNVPVLTLSQLSRATESAARKTPRPRLSDLRDSGSIEQDADIVMFLYREDYEDYRDRQGEQSDTETADRGKSYCCVAKNRHGSCEDVELHWSGEYTRFTSVDYRQ